MARTRLDFHNLLLTALASENVYFQQPPPTLMLYPCIIYTRSDLNQQYANNHIYSNKTEYSVTVIDSDPDSSIPERISNIPLASLETIFVRDNLNHTVFSIFY